MTQSPEFAATPGAAETKVRLDGVSRHYGGVVALDDIHLEVIGGEFLTLLGPSGSGKTTLLNLIAGMVSPTSGRIWIDGTDVTNTPPSKRGLGMVFQNYALMPHMTIFENVAFPLRVRKLPKEEIKRRVGDVLELVRLPDVARRKPSELSGGQQQRIAIARCLVYNPSIILMDEPLGALDKKLREEMQLELKRLHGKLGITALYVTHDQEEALTMSDRIVLLNGGRIEQMGTPDELYFQPRSLFAAQFLGDSNILGGKVRGMGPTASVETDSGHGIACRSSSVVSEGEAVKVMVRPENVTMLADGATSELANQLPARAIDSIFFGGVVKCYAQLADGTTMVVQELTSAGRQMPRRQERVTVAWAAEDSLILPLPGRPPTS